MPPKIADAIRILAAETLEGCSNDWSDSAKADEVLRAVYDLIFEAGVQAERERWEAEIQTEIDGIEERLEEVVDLDIPTCNEQFPLYGRLNALRAVLAVVTVLYLLWTALRGW
jgi:hypothetical protein